MAFRKERKFLEEKYSQLLEGYYDSVGLYRQKGGGGCVCISYMFQCCVVSHLAFELVNVLVSVSRREMGEAVVLEKRSSLMTLLQ